MRRSPARVVLAVLIGLLYILHQDDWLAASTRRVAGLPASLAWHLGLCLLTSVVMAAAVGLAWPPGDADDDDAAGTP